KMDAFAAEALEAVKSGEVDFFPPHFINMYENWLKEENVRDWCISRQLWWGQRIPAWYHGEEVFVAATEEEALAQAREKLGADIRLEDLKQDEDVLDTWFSSWLWPISVFHGFQGQEELRYYYPTQVLVTAWDIIYLWVARMIMAGYTWSEDLLGTEHMEKTGKQPFNHVYFTGMVRDNKRRKMSKSLGNSPDALVLLDKYGADGVRFGMLSSASAGNDIIFDAPIDPKTGQVLNESKLCDQGLNFSNKMWNALRLIEGWEQLPADDPQPAADQLAIDWMHHAFYALLEQLDKSYNNYRLSEVVMDLYNFIWNNFCSWFLEMIKPAYGEAIHPATKQAAIELFEKQMIVLHPVMPFVTEEIWHALKERSTGEDIIVAEWPEKGKVQDKVLKQIESLKELVSKVRDIRQQFGLKKSEALELYAEEGNFYSQLTNDQALMDLLKKMAVLGSVDTKSDTDKNLIDFISGVDKFYVAVEQEVDWAEELAKIEKDIEYYQGFLKSVEKKLSNERFVNNAPEAVVEKERQKKADGETKLANLLQAKKDVEGKVE
ncbi:MAG TPA: class I tRNA ligase family protein, partial [Saprospiraceae bacterium]|nr:class I tRNA ligase family protein [Saprospiraceae bacterium]